ncbi:MAG: cobalt-precorrin-5B (C(1))-methyltransferase CbiD [Ignisphaera sp.]|nr:cobalt-precorrin-5B (C(1))-methyltransferase CbiD [Ignisphaera sp.]MDW8086275.1 cobalt-precorrin-5B (C(1))-methyltransferase CbiD [Ignisphaera sp.]
MTILQLLKRFGITTGAAAAAAAKAAALYTIRRVGLEAVVVPTPIGLRIEIPVEAIYTFGDSVCAVVRKFAGDNIDVLDGVAITACVRVRGDRSITVAGGRGVGVVTRPGLPIPVGQKAISPSAREMIIAAVREVSSDVGFDVVVEVPVGEELARRTVNEAVGIVGGISILGTTGIEWPVSSSEDLHRIGIELDITRSRYSDVVIAVGNRSYTYASRIYTPEIIVKVGDSVGWAVLEARNRGFSKIVIAALPSKALKLAAGLFNTSSRVGDARIETLTHACAAVGLDPSTVRMVALSHSVGEALEVLGSSATARVFEYIGGRVVDRFKRVHGIEIGVVIFSRDGEVVARVGRV